jgi:ketosteroid isomerase-like protein
VNRRDFDAVISFYVPDAVWETGLEVIEGREAIRGFFEDVLASYEEYDSEAVEMVDLGNGVTFAVLLSRGGLPGSSGDVQMRWAAVAVWEDGLIERLHSSTDIDEARAAAERLAQERG